MRYLRLTLPCIDSASLVGLIERVGPHVLQIDVARPESWPGYRRGGSGWNELGCVLPSTTKALYLQPDLAVLTNAGYPNSVDTASALAEFLVSHGSSNLPIAAIRGDNLLPNLDDFIPEEALPANSKVLSARIEIGGGPIATALSEGARWVVAGSYDGAAPLLGAAVAHGIITWHDSQELALLTAVSHFERVAVDVEESGVIELESAALEQLNQVRSHGPVMHADLQTDLSQLALEPTERNTLRPSNVLGESTQAMWNARIVVQTGYRSAAIVTGAADAVVRIADQAAFLCGEGSVSIAEYAPVGQRHAERSSLVRVEFRSLEHEACRKFVDWLQLFLGQNSAVGQLLAPFPAVAEMTQTIFVSLPADTVTISVDTRPAHEWL